MLDSYFFIPADKQKYLDKIESLNSDYIIIDLEDAVALKSKNEAFDLTLTVIPKKNHFVRIPFFDNCYSEKQLNKLIHHFEGRIIVPKLTDKEQLIQIKNLAPNVNLAMILLVENPRCYINLRDILNAFSEQTKAIGFGSHDFCSITGIKHTSENLENYKRELILYTKAFNVDYIDGVDLNLTDINHFREQCVFAFEIGSNGKFLIHPSQLDELSKVRYFSKQDVEQFKTVYEKVKDIPDDSVNIYNINGIVYEKPHIVRIKYIMQKLNINKNK